MRAQNPQSPTALAAALLAQPVLAQPPSEELETTLGVDHLPGGAPGAGQPVGP